MSEKAETVSASEAPKGNKSLLTVAVVVLLVLVVLLAIGFAYMLLTGGSGSSGLTGGGGGLLGSNMFDQDVFIVNMDTVVLNPEDFSTSYKVSSNQRFDNAQYSHNMGAAYAKPFILNTGRVDGWDLSMERSNPNDFAPGTVRSRVDYYETVDGASTALSEEWFWAYQLEDRIPDQFLDKNCNVGKDCITFMYKEAKPGSGAIIERYDTAFRYKNVVIWVFIKGQQGEVSEDLVLSYGELVLEKLQMLEE